MQDSERSDTDTLRQLGTTGLVEGLEGRCVPLQVKYLNRGKGAALAVYQEFRILLDGRWQWAADSQAATTLLTTTPAPGREDASLSIEHPETGVVECMEVPGTCSGVCCGTCRAEDMALGDTGSRLSLTHATADDDVLSVQLKFSRTTLPAGTAARCAADCQLCCCFCTNTDILEC